MIRIEVVGDPSSYPEPAPIKLTLACDSETHGFFSVSQSFEHPDGFMTMYHLAMISGWKDTFRKGERVFLCPDCSGKQPRDHRIGPGLDLR